MFDQLRIGSEAKKAQKFTPIHPNPEIGKKHGISLLLHGKHSELYRNATADMMRRSRKGGRTTDGAIEESATLIVTCCAGWKGVTEKDDPKKEKKFNRRELHAMLIDDDFRWLRLQAEQFMQDDDPFFQNTATD